MDLLRILALWRGRAGWLAAGLLISLAALGCGVALMAVSGALIGTAVAAGALVAPLALRGLGIGRVVRRYLERLVTHAATFRALADLRVWFFRHLARTAAGGLGFRHAGDVLSRLVVDVEALDGLYLRILVPLAGAVLLLPALLIVIGRRRRGTGGGGRGVVRASPRCCCPGWRPAPPPRPAAASTATASALRIAALDALTGLREVRAFGAEGRMIAARPGPRGRVALRPARSGAAHRAGRRRRVPVRPGGDLRGAAGGRHQPGRPRSPPPSW